MKNWKTTLCGAVGAGAAYLMTMEDPTVKIVGQVLAGLATFLMGFFAKDAGVTGTAK